MGSDKAAETHRLLIESEENCGRIDKVLSALCPDLSRTRIQALIEDGQVHLNGKPCTSASCKLSVNDKIDISIPPPQPAEPVPENIPLDIVYEDNDLLVINKAAGMVVHPGAGNQTGTLVNALLHHCGETLSGIGGVMRPGIVHRLDKDTSGLMVVAKHDKAHKGLSAQLQDRSLSRIYKALVFKPPVPLKGVIDAPLGRHSGNRLKMAVQPKTGKDARTHYHVQEVFRDICAFVECRLESGRTHQIRVHMGYLKHPIIGDPLYGPQPNALESGLKKAGYTAETVTEVLDIPRQMLHAQSLKFIHPVSQADISLTSDLPDDFFNILKLLDN